MSSGAPGDEPREKKEKKSSKSRSSGTSRSGRKDGSSKSSSSKKKTLSSEKSVRREHREKEKIAKLLREAAESQSTTSKSPPKSKSNPDPASDRDRGVDFLLTQKSKSERRVERLPSTRSASMSLSRDPSKRLHTTASRKHTPAHSGRSRTTSVGDHHGGSPPRRGRRVKFNQVQVREFDRRHGGSGGVPEEGYFPLGLDWNYRELPASDVHEFDSVRQLQGRRSARTITPLEDFQRKAILDGADERQMVAKQSSYRRTAQEVRKILIRRDKGSEGCDCQNGCRTILCRCKRNGDECFYRLCDCDKSKCKNGGQYLIREQLDALDAADDISLMGQEIAEREEAMKAQNKTQQRGNVRFNSDANANANANANTNVSANASPHPQSHHPTGQRGY